MNSSSAHGNIVLPERVFLAYYSRLQAMKLAANILLILIYVLAAVAHGNPMDIPAVMHFQSSLTHQLSVHDYTDYTDYTESFFTLDAFRKTYSNVIIPPGVSDPGAMTTGPLPPPEPANHVEESSDEDEEEEDEEEEDEDDHEDKEENDILPPTVRRQPGRPRKARTDAEKERRRLRRVNYCPADSEVPIVPCGRPFEEDVQGAS
jgi:hypothetical protein